MTARRTASRLLPVLLLLSGGVAACGGEGDPEPARTSASSEAGFTIEDGIAPDELLGCLEDAGLPAEEKDATPMGVEVPVVGLDVGPLEGGTGPDSPQGAVLWVFTSGVAAEENRPLITLASEDTASSWVADNVVVRLFYPADEGDPQIAALTGCLPG